jgi:transcriptional regulator with XRE-family HTH domain
MNAIGDLLRQHRARLGLSQERLAALAGVDLSNLNRIEGGKRRCTEATATRLCDGLGLTPFERTVFHLTAGHVPPGLDAPRLRMALTLVRVATVEEIEAAGRLVAAARSL